MEYGLCHCNDGHVTLLMCSCSNLDFKSVYFTPYEALEDTDTYFEAINENRKDRIVIKRIVTMTKKYHKLGT